MRRNPHSQDDLITNIAIDDAIASSVVDAFKESTASGLLQLAGIGNKTTLPLAFGILAQLGSAISESRLTTG